MFDKPTRVLVTPCGSGIGQEIYHSLSHRRDLELYGLDANENSPGKIIYGKRFYYGAPLLSDREQLLQYVKYFVKLHEIEYVFPCTDLFINFLKENEDELGAKVITSPLETCIIARKKSLTYQTLKDVVRVPKMFKLEDVEDFPVFIKPDTGAASRGCKIIHDKKELVSSHDRERDLICEYLPGPSEYTVDCLSSAGDLLYHCPRERTITRAGISIVTSAVKSSSVIEEIHEMALKINGAVEFTGAWFFQVKHSNGGELALLEIAPRIGGGSAFSRCSGVNLPLLSLNLAMGLPSKVPVFQSPERTIKVYKAFMDPPLEFDSLYVDLDDTLVIKGRVNPEAMACVYRCKSRGILIHLVTRRPTSVREYLNRFHIPESIFTSIRQIHDLGPKSQFISPGSVFVDDSFKERQEVSSSGKNIRCFDVDSFNFL